MPSPVCVCVCVSCVCVCVCVCGVLAVTHCNLKCYSLRPVHVPSLSPHKGTRIHTTTLSHENAHTPLQ
ncbi:MAG: hypothetical protein P4L40_03310 [Terracidiphilus sp.]|nr:hypothetical protein [Terracidiphilus sp.]